MDFNSAIDNIETHTLNNELEGSLQPVLSEWKWPSAEESRLYTDSAERLGLSLESICATPLGFHHYIHYLRDSTDERVKVDFLCDSALYRQCVTAYERQKVGEAILRCYFCDEQNQDMDAEKAASVLMVCKAPLAPLAEGLCRDVKPVSVFWQEYLGNPAFSSLPLGLSRHQVLPELILADDNFSSRREDHGGPSDNKDPCSSPNKNLNGDGGSESKRQWRPDSFVLVDCIVWNFMREMYGGTKVTSLPFWPTYARFRQISERPPVDTAFSLFRILGKGGFGLVCGCKYKPSGQLYAMKIMDRRLVKLNGSEVLCQNERKALHAVDSKFVVCLHFAYVTKSDLVLVIDLMRGGDLDYHLKLPRNARGFSTVQARYWTARTVLGIASLHERQLVYRDLKPENVLLGEDGRSKLSDLGLACHCPPGGGLRGTCGTPGYMAPEMLRKQKYGVSVDWFSLGCMVYELLTGSSPFNSPRAQEWINGRVADTEEGVARIDPKAGLELAVLEMDPCFDDDVIVARPGQAPESAVDRARALDFCRCLLDKDPTCRLGRESDGASAVMAHAWFSEDATFSWARVRDETMAPPYIPESGVNAIDQSGIGEFKDASHVALTEEDDACFEQWTFLNLRTFDAAALQAQEHERIAAVPDGDGKCCTIA